MREADVEPRTLRAQEAAARQADDHCGGLIARFTSTVRCTRRRLVARPERPLESHQGPACRGEAQKSTSALSESLRGSGEHGGVGLAEMSRVVFRMAIPDVRLD